ncbi:MAG: ChbG/HpnK family deacetylase, partial [Deltaproteobacteria bacterium]|nr:ChbG/HpnK family deacetylase [Deltaproteobacteria bacterium]
EIFGLFETGAMIEEAWLSLIPKIKEGVTEVYCHPATKTAGILKETMPDYRHAEELEALLSPRLKELLKKEGVILGCFADDSRSTIHDPRKI